MIHFETTIKKISEEKGLGVVAKKLIPKGTITWVQDPLDLVYSAKEVETLGGNYNEIIDKYTFRDNLGNYILCWDHGKYINHSFNSNCMTTPYGFEIAIRDILPGEELTDDYGYLNISKPFKAIPEEGNRTIVNPDDLLVYYKQWDKFINDAIQFIDTVNQPLFKFLSEDVRENILDVLAGDLKMDSIKTCYFNPNGKMNFSKN
jgi:hypothetical protein